MAKKNTKNLRLGIIEELADLHNKVGYKSEELDENLIQTISDRSASNEEIKALRADMWFEYTRLLLENVNYLITELLENFVAVENVQSFNKKFVSLQQGYEKLRPENQDVEMIKNLFNDVFALYQEIRADENVLKRAGRDRFLLKIYPPYVTIISAAYWGLFVVANQQLKIENFLFFGVGGWIIVLFISYFFAKWLFRRGLRPKKIELSG